MEADTSKLFWKLGTFARFDFKRFSADASHLKVTSFMKTTEVIRESEDKNTNVQNPNNKKEKKARITPSKKAHLRGEEINRIRNSYHIHVIGSDISPPLSNFTELKKLYGLKEKILTNINFQGFTEPTGVQRQVIPLMLQERDVMVCAPTGSGKTLAFLIPLIFHCSLVTDSKAQSTREGPHALVLAPTRELAKQIQHEFRKIGKGMHVNISLMENSTTARKCQHRAEILVTTPNRLVHMIEQELIHLGNLSWLVVDESDKLFEAGQRGFRDQLGTIYRACANPSLHRALFSATFAQEVEHWCKLNLDNVVHVSIGARNSANSNVKQELIFTGDESGKLIAFRELVQQGIEPPVLVFVQSKERAKHLFTELRYDSICLDVIHGDRPQDQREEVVKNFRKGKVWVLVCTELLGRGIDFKGVNLVINYDFPTSAVSYIHRVGRTGRAGRQGRAVSFFTENDKTLLRSIAGMIRNAGCPVPDYLMTLKKPGRKHLRSLAKHVPERDSILTMNPDDYERLKRKRKIKHNHLGAKKRK